MKIKCAEINLNETTTKGALVVPLNELKNGLDCAFGNAPGDELEEGDVITITINEWDKSDLEKIGEWDGF